MISKNYFNYCLKEVHTTFIFRCTDEAYLTTPNPDSTLEKEKNGSDLNKKTEHLFFPPNVARFDVPVVNFKPIRSF